MKRCEVCGNEYDKAFEVAAAGATHTFDSFECAIHLMAPVCEHCGCKVIGHGVEVEGRFYCCAHCARQAESTDAPVDRVDHTAAAVS
jgi:Rieske Fe-S protein